MMSGKSRGASSRSGGVSSNAGERSVRQAENAAHREAVNDRLGAIEAGADEGGVRLKKSEDSTVDNGGAARKD